MARLRYPTWPLAARAASACDCPLSPMLDRKTWCNRPNQPPDRCSDRSRAAFFRASRCMGVACAGFLSACLNLHSIMDRSATFPWFASLKKLEGTDRSDESLHVKPGIILQGEMINYKRIGKFNLTIVLCVCWHATWKVSLAVRGAKAGSSHLSVLDMYYRSIWQRSDSQREVVPWNEAQCAVKRNF